MLDMAVHALTWVVAVAGPARQVTAFARTAVPTRQIAGQTLDVDIDDNVTVLLDFGDGVLGNVIANYVTVADAAPTFDVFGTEGTIHVGAPQAQMMQFSRGASYLGQSGWLTPTVFAGHRAQPLAAPGRGDGGETPPHSSIGHFVDCLAEDREPVPSGEIARHVLEIMVRAAEAARTGQTQSLETTFAHRGG